MNKDRKYPSYYEVLSKDYGVWYPWSKFLSIYLNAIGQTTRLVNDNPLQTEETNTWWIDSPGMPIEHVFSQMTHATEFNYIPFVKK